MAYIRVINRQTGKAGFLPQENFDPNKYIEEGGQQQAPRSFAQNVGSGIASIPGALLKPFSNTAQRVGGAAETALRAFLVNASEKALKDKDYDRAMQLGQIASADSALTRGEKPELTDPLQIAKDSAAMLSWGVPVGGATKAFGKGIATSVGGGGALTGAMGGFGYSKETTPEGLLGSTVLGAGTGFATAKILNKLFPGKKSPTQEVASQPGGLEKAGLDLKRAAIRPQAGGGPGSILDENEMITSLSEKGITGSPTNMRYKVADLYKKDYAEIGNILKNNPSEVYDINAVKQIITDEVTTKGTYFVPGDKTYESLLNRELALLDKNAVNGGINAEGIYKAIGNLNKQLGKAYDKASGISEAAITAPEGVRLDINNVLHDALVEAAPAQVAPLSAEMSLLHKASPGLKSASLESANLFGVPVPGVGQGVLTAENKIGDALIGAGRLAGKVGQGIQTSQPILNTAVGGKLPALTAFMTQGQGQSSQAAPADASIEPQNVANIFSKEKYQQMILEDLVKTGGKNGASIEAAYKRLGGGEEATNLTEAQVARQRAATSVERALMLVQKGSVNTGLIGGPLENLKAKAGVADPETLEFNTLISSIKASIAKARAGTSFTPNEEKLLNKYTPNVGDSYQELVTKLKGLQAMGI